MRPKTVILTLVVGLICINGLILLWQFGPSKRGVPNQSTAAEQSASSASNQPAVPQATEADSSSANASTNTPAEGQENGQEDYVQTRIQQLGDLAMSGETDSLNIILSELTNRDPEIRKAALDATIQFGSRDAIPKLMDTIVQVEDPREQVAIMDAIDFLKLPSITEVMEQRAAAAKRQAQQ